MSKYVKFAYERAVPELAPFAGVVELNGCRQKLLERRLIGMDSTPLGQVHPRYRQGRRDQQFSYHWFGNRWITGTDAGGLRESGGLQF